MSTIDVSYFKGELLIANRGSSEIQDNLQYFIDKYEKDYLYKLLGSTLAEEYIAGIAMATPDSKWTDIQARLYDATNKVSQIANYIYVQYMRNNTTFTSGTGEVKAKNENSNPAASYSKEVRAWNEMVDLANSTYDWLYENISIYPYLENRDCDKGIFGYINRFGF